MRLHLPQQGEVGFAGGQSGDLYLEISISPDLVFGRDGDDITATLEVPVPDAALGFRTAIETFDGELEVEVKAGAQNGDEVVLRGYGVTKLRGKGRGDLRIKLKVLTPQTVDSRQRELFQKLRDLGKEEKPRLATKKPKGRF